MKINFEQVLCESCGVKIRTVTADKTGGLCYPCSKSSEAADSRKKLASFPFSTKEITLDRCHESWEEMEGDEEVKYCSKCHLNVYNFDEMSKEEAIKLIESKGDNLCARMYRDINHHIRFKPCQERPSEGRRLMGKIRVKNLTK